MVSNNMDGGITTSSVSVTEQILQVLHNYDLRNLSDSDKLLCERIQHDLMKNDDQKYLSMHKGKVTKGKDGRLVTNVHVPSGAYITVRGRDRDVLNQEIIRCYKEDINKPSFIPIFNEWLDYHLAEGEIGKATYTRYKTHAKRFFDKDSTFCKTPLAKMTDKIITDFLEHSIREYHLTEKVFSNLCTLVRKTFRYAKDKGYTTYSISAYLEGLDIPKSYFEPPKRVKGSEDVFTIAETDVLLPYLRKKGDIYSLGLILMFETGLRVGEITALRNNCVSESSLRVCATEVSYDDDNGKRIFVVQDKPKTPTGDRIVYLPAQAKETIKAIRSINPDGEFLLMKDGKRIRTKSMRYHLKRACEEVEILKRAYPHQTRKTYTSALLDSKVNLRFVMEQVGHADSSTTLNTYNRNRLGSAQKEEVLTRSIPF